MEKMKNNGLMAYVTVAAVIVAVASQIGGHNSRVQRDAALMARDSVEAANDTTRKFLLGELVGWQRRAVQTELERDELDRRLKIESAFRSKVELAIKRLDAKIPADTVMIGETGAIVVPFAYREKPYTLDGTMNVSADTQRAVLDIHITLDTAKLEVRVGCSNHPVSQATVNVSTPSWLTTRLDSVVSETRVCNPPKDARHGWLKPAAVGVGLGVIGAAILNLVGGN